MFSQRYGYKPMKEVIQKESIDEVLKNKIWSLLTSLYWSKIKQVPYSSYCSINSSSNSNLKTLTQRLWYSYFNEPIDTIDDDWDSVLRFIRNYFYNAMWYEVFDLIEFIALNYPEDETNRIFLKMCNKALEDEMSAYRFIEDKITEIIDDNEIESIETAISSREKAVTTHLKRALELLSDRKQPDYRNSIKESISAVESISSIITGEEKGTLGKLLAILDKDNKIHPSMKSGFTKMYGFTSDSNGIRHALLDEDSNNFDDAKYMLVICSAFINYIKAKQ